MLMFTREDLEKTVRKAIQKDKRDLKKLKIETENDVEIKHALEKRIDYFKEMLKNGKE